MKATKLVIVTFPMMLTGQQRDNVKARILDEMSTLENPPRILVMDGGAVVTVVDCLPAVGGITTTTHADGTITLKPGWTGKCAHCAGTTLSVTPVGWHCAECGEYTTNTGEKL